MSVKFQEETVRTVTGGKPEHLAHRVGERLTGGKTQTGYLQVCTQLVEKECSDTVNCSIAIGDNAVKNPG